MLHEHRYQWISFEFNMHGTHVLLHFISSRLDFVKHNGTHAKHIVVTLLPLICLLTARYFLFASRVLGTTQLVAIHLDSTLEMCRAQLAQHCSERVKKKDAKNQATTTLHSFIESFFLFRFDLLV